MKPLFEQIGSIILSVFDKASAASFGGVSLGVVQFLMALAGIVMVGKSFQKVYMEHPTADLKMLISEWWRTGSRLAGVGLFVAGSAVLTATLSAGVQAMIRPIPEKISTAAGTLADTQVALLKNIWAFDILPGLKTEDSQWCSRSHLPASSGA